jgi:hypothetical protein
MKTKYKRFFGMLAALLFLASCENAFVRNILPEPEQAAPETVDTPVASPSGGTYTSAQTVTLSCATRGADIYFTINGAAPTESGTPYTGAVYINTDTTLKAVAVKRGMADSGILTARYVINPAAPPLSGTVSINGSAVVGRTLTAAVSGANGTGTPTYQWIRGNATIIEGAAQSTYIPVDADVGSAIKVKVTYAGFTGELVSSPTALVTFPALSGTVSINGSAVVGRTLTAAISGANGTGTPTYQWIRGNATIIEGADQSTYIPVDADVGSAIKVKVTYAGFTGELVSSPTALVVLPVLTGMVSISGSAIVGETLTAVILFLEEADNITCQWIKDDTAIEGADQSTYIPVAADVGSLIKVKITYAGFTGELVSEPTAAVTFPALTGTVSISGSAVVGEILTAAVSGTNGTGTPAYQWIRGDSTNIGANQRIYTPVAADVGSVIKVKVTYAGFTGKLVSEPTAAVTLPALTGTVSISGSVIVGETLTAAVSGTNGTGTPAYQWIRGDSTNIDGADQSTYTLVAADVGSVIKVKVTYAGFTGELESEPTAAVTLPALTGTVSISGSAVVGQTLTASYSNGNGSGTAAWQWIRGDSTFIEGANSNTYTVSYADYDQTLKARVSYSNQSGSVTSEATDTIQHTDLKAAFGITATGAAGVTAAFNAVHDYLQGRTAAQVASDGVIQLGDYIDLASLSIAGYPMDTSGYGKLNNAQNTPINYTGSDAYRGPSASGTLLRLIVVGINSFNAQGNYTGNDNGNSAHLVFHFQNVPVRRRMEENNTNANGYAGSEMRRYLVGTGGPDNTTSGKFLAGLKNAGIPVNVLWAPKRYVANKGTGATAADLIEDLLWLPTEGELFGFDPASYTNNGSHSAWGPLSNQTYENETNQARFAYYTSDAQRIKYNSSNSCYGYVDASPHTSTVGFCTVNSDGSAYGSNASSVGGCAPAFCVK